MNQFNDQVFVVTGASTGFGRGIAHGLALQGAAVVVADLKQETTEGNYDESPDLSTSELIERDGGRAVFSRCDVSSMEDVTEAVDLAVSTFGRLDGFVNNAGVYRGGPFHELTPDDLGACFDVIVRGTWNGSRAAIDHFLSRPGGGSILNVVSTAGLRGHAFQAPYNLAKGAQANLTRALAVEYAASNIRINGVCPTYMKSSMSRVAAEAPAFQGVVDVTIPLGKMGEISDVANAALHLLSPASSFLTGVLLPVDGGETAGAPAVAFDPS